MAWSRSSWQRCSQALAPEEVAAGLGAQDPPVGFLEQPVHAGVADSDADGVAAGGVDGLADLVQAGQGLLLGRRADPLGEAGAVVPAGVPRARAHGDLAVGAVAVQVVLDEAGADAAASVVPYPVQQVLVEGVPEVGLRRGVAEPAAVVAVGAGGHEGREVTVPGPLGHLVYEPAGVHPCLLGVGQLPVPDHDGDFLAAEPGDVRAVAQFVPAHGGDRVDVRAVDQDVAVAIAFEGGDELHAKTHLRGPEPGEAGPREQVPADPLPALELLIPVGMRDQGQDGMVVAGAQDADDRGVLQVPQQRPAVGDAVGAVLEAGTGQGLQQGAGQRQVHPAGILIRPQRPGNPVHRPQDLPGLPLALAEEVLKVAGGLMQVEDQGEGHLSHRGSLGGYRS